jgi:hypothetical protein
MLEECDIMDLFGDEYRCYRQRVAMIVPLIGGGGRAAGGTEKPLGIDIGQA